MEVQKTEKELRQRKMLVFLPVIVVPLLALVFHALGGGRGADPTTAKSASKGLNMSLPDARFDPKKKGLDKMGAYGQADVDSAKMEERKKQDPFYRDSAVRHSWTAGRPAMDTSWRRALVPGASTRPAGVLHTTQTDVQADELLGKLDRLKDVLRHQEETTSSSTTTVSGRPAASFPARVEPDVYRPGRMAGGDPDLDKLNVMLDKVLKIQHPEDAPQDTLPVVARVAGHIVGVLSPAPGGRTGADTGQVLGVGNIPDPGGRERDEVDGLGSGFMDIDASAAGDSVAETTVLAVVARDQTLVSGASVELRLEQDAVIGGRLIPRGNPLWGKAALSGERLSIGVSSLRVGAEVYPVNMEVFDLDGMIGVRVEGSINRDAAKASADEALGTVGVTSLDPSIAGQATAAGIQAARSLISRKVRLVRVTLKAGYRVLLKNNKSINR